MWKWNGLKKVLCPNKHYKVDNRTLKLTVKISERRQYRRWRVLTTATVMKELTACIRQLLAVNYCCKALHLRSWCRSGVFIVNFEHIPHFFFKCFYCLVCNRWIFVGESPKSFCFHNVQELENCRYIKDFWLCFPQS